MADYAGAVAAIKARLTENWTQTPIGTLNGADVDKLDDSGDPTPWVFLEVVNSGSTLIGAGKPGDHRWVYDGLILVHVFVPSGSGTDTAFGLAVTAGEIFRAAEFYKITPGCCVRSWSPRVDGGDSASDDGLWWRVTATIPFEYLHRG